MDSGARTAGEVRPVHPLIHAGKWMLADMLSTLVFVGLYAATHSIATATALAIAIGLGRIAYQFMRGIPIELMQWLALFLVVVFGGATLLTRDPVFVMVKPTLIYGAIGAVMMRPGWINRYVPPVARQWGADVNTAFGFAWAGLMFATGAANLVVAALASPAAWAWFVGLFPIGSKLVLAGVQYVVSRSIIRRRIRGAVAVA
jgi:intracellular septation protein A